MKTLSLIVPVFNEEQRLQKIFSAINNLKLPPDLHLTEIIFVNDGSTDRSDKLIKAYVAKKPSHPSYRLVSFSHNIGKGQAVREGMLLSKADYAVFCDADNSTSLSEINKLNRYIQQDAPLIIGSRKDKRSSVLKHQPLIREKLGGGFTAIANTLLSLKVDDYTCGFKAFSKHARLLLFSQSRINRWGFDAEILYLAQKRYHFQIAKIPVRWSYDTQTKVKLLRDIPASLIELLFIVWLYRILPSLSLNAKEVFPHKALKH